MLAVSTFDAVGGLILNAIGVRLVVNDLLSGATAARPPQRRPMSDLIIAPDCLGYTLVGAHWLTCRRR